MDITIKKCDICLTDYRSDGEDPYFGKFEDSFGRPYDVCGLCTDVLMRHRAESEKELRKQKVAA